MPGIVDAHLHLWDTIANPYPWLTDPEPGSDVAELAERFSAYLVDDYRRDCGSRAITGTVHVQADWDPRDPAGETAWLQVQHDLWGVPTAIVGAAELESPGVRDTLEAHLRSPAFRGIRQPLAWDDDPALRATARSDWMDDAAWRRGFALLAPLGLSFDLTVYPSQLAAAAVLAARHPSTPIVLDHAGQPDVARADRAVWSDGLRRLAACDNVTVKLSGLSHPGRCVEQMLEYVEEVLAVFGCARAMWGSNLPVEHLAGSADAVAEAVGRALARRTPGERDAVWSTTATRVYRLGDGS